MKEESSFDQVQARLHPLNTSYVHELVHMLKEKDLFRDKESENLIHGTVRDKQLVPGVATLKHLLEKLLD